jgi:tetratricopeptide (TPR) repeat protein
MTIAALVLPLALLQADAATGSGRVAERFEQCVATIDQDAERGYEDAMAWASEAQSAHAYRCAAMALVAQNRYGEGARRLDSLGLALNPEQGALRAELFSQAGNAWLLAREPARARASFTRAIAIVGSGETHLPELLIDRARAYAMEGEWRSAEEDLNRALDLRPRDALALRLRAEARMQQSAFDLAEADANAAIAVAPGDVDNYLILGHIRESRRLGAPVDVR